MEDVNGTRRQAGGDVGAVVGVREGGDRREDRDRRDEAPRRKKADRRGGGRE